MFKYFVEKEFKANKTCNSLKYLYYRPDTDEKIPLIIYIHGSGSRGTDPNKMSLVGPLGEVEKGRKVNAVIVAPQCYTESWFELFETLLDFAENAINTENIDKNRVYLCGISMGSYAAWQLALANPEWYAALVPVCGGGMYWNLARLKKLPIWAFHGKMDHTVLPRENEEMVKRVNSAGGNAKITLYDGVAHDSWVKAYADDEMWKWMFSQKRSNQYEF